VNPGRRDSPAPSGRLIINADDWGRDGRTTDMIADCVSKGAVSSVSAMVFMEDSERAAAIARDRGIDAGLHLNFTTPFSSASRARLAERQRVVGRFLRSHRLAQALFHPGLVRTFAEVVGAQTDEYHRLYRADPPRFDGHHHMHLCANVLLQGLLPHGAAVRRSFSFQPGEKGRVNRLYRRCVDRWLIRSRYRLTDFFFSIAPLAPAGRLERLIRLSDDYVVELETHPADDDEYRFLTGGGLSRTLGTARISNCWLPSSTPRAEESLATRLDRPYASDFERPLG